MSESWSSETGTGGEGGPSEAQRARALQRVRAPAIGLLATAGVGLFFGLGMLVVVGTGSFAELFDLPPELQEQLAGSQNLVFTLAQMGFLLAACAVVAWGAWGMLRLRGWALAVAAGFIALVPCTSPCCLLGLPIGIWALVVLFDKDVKASFT